MWSVEFEEFIIECKRKPLGGELIYVFFQGKGTSSTTCSSNGHVYLIGAVLGAHLQSIEEWTNEDLTSQDILFSAALNITSSIIVSACLGLDGEIQRHASQCAMGQLEIFLVFALHHRSTNC